MNTTLTTLFLLGTFSSFAQVVGGRSNSDMTPSVAEPAKISSGGFSGDVNLFSGAYGATIPLGSVKTPNGLAFNLAFNYNSTFTVGTTPQLATGIPYGEGWNLNIPTISVETEAFDNFTYQEYCDENAAAILAAPLNFGDKGKDALLEGDLYWYSPYIDIPGVVSGRAIFKFVDVNDNKTAVFVLNSFETQVELRLNKQGWTVILSDGTMYRFATAMRSYSAPANQRVLYYDQTNLSGNSSQTIAANGVYASTSQAGIVGNSVTPKTTYSLWYCNQISHRNMPGQSINFIYQKFGAFNYFKEFDQPAYAPAAAEHFAATTFANAFETVYTDILLERVEATSITSLAQEIRLNYATNTAILGSNPELIDFRGEPEDIQRIDSLYTSDVVFYDSRGEDDFDSGWKRYEHTKANTTTRTVNPQHYPYLTSDNKYVRSGAGGDTDIPFAHSFLETPRITGLIPGDIYEIRTTVSRTDDEDLTTSNGTIDIAVVTGDLGDPDGSEETPPSFSSLNANSGIYYLKSDYDATRGVPIFSTFNMAMKWMMAYKESVKQTSNFFVMPNIPDAFGGINIQIGPGNADVEPSSYWEQNSNLIDGSDMNGRAAYAFNYYHSGFPLRSAADIPRQFGIGFPWGMMIPIYTEMALKGTDLSGSTGNIDDVFNLWWNNFPTSPLGHVNQPTKLDETVSLDQLELVRYTKNPYMLTSVESYNVNGEVGSPENEGLKLIAKKVLEYTQDDTPILDNYAYAEDDELKFKNLQQIRILLHAVRDIPVIPTSDTTQYPTTFMDYTDFTSGDNEYHVTKPLNGYTGKVLRLFSDHLGGITRIEYYPVLDNRTYYSTRFSKTNYCDLFVTDPAFGLAKAVSVHPVVQYILKNDEDDLVKEDATSANNDHKRWEYDFDVTTKVHKPIGIDMTDGRFHNGRRSSFDHGFRKVSVYGPTLTAGGNDYVNKTVYEHHGYQLTGGGGSPGIEDYLFHGKLKSIKEYDDANKLFTEKLIDYDYTLAFMHGYTRPNLWQEDIEWDQQYNNPGGQYEYRDYYLDLELQVGLLSGPDAYGELDIPVFTGTGEPIEQPKFMDFYFYPILDSLYEEKQYFLHSYFVKKAEEINRTYDDYLYKLNIISGGTLPEVVSPAPNPFGGGLVNGVPYVHSRDAVLFGYAVGISRGAFDTLVAHSPLSDTVLYHVIVSGGMNGNQTTQLLKDHPEGLSDQGWIWIIDNITKFSEAELLDLIRMQPYFSDEILEHLSQSIDNTWDNDVVREFFTRNEYLSYPSLLDLTDTGVSYLSAGTYTAIMVQQPQMPEDILLRIVGSSFVSTSHFNRIFENQELTDDVWTEIIDHPSVTETTILALISEGISFPTETMLLYLMDERPLLDADDWEAITDKADRDLTVTEILQLETMFPAAPFLALIEFKGSPLQKYCNTPTDTGWDYIETKTTYEYYEANYRGVAQGRAYKVLMSLEDIPSRTISLTDVFGSGGTKTVSQLCLKHEPSWQLFSAKTTSVHLPTAKKEDQYFYLYDLRNRYDRYWYNCDVNDGDGELTHFIPVVMNGGLDTLVYTARWDEDYGLSYQNEGPEIPKYDGMIKTRQYNMRSTPFQKTTFTKSQRNEEELSRSEYYDYDARWVFDLDLTVDVAFYPGESCPETGDPDPDPVGCQQCMYWKYGTETELLQLLPNGYCLWEDDVIGFYACPYGIAPDGCYEGATLVDCNPSLGEENIPDPLRFLPLGDYLGKTLQLRSTVVQMDTIMGIIDDEFAEKRFDRRNRYIAEFHMLYDGTDENGFNNPYRMIYPFDTLTTLKILERNEHLQPALIKNPAGIRTRFYYRAHDRIWYDNENCNNPAYAGLHNYLVVDAPDIGLPIRVTVGWGRTDSLSTAYEYTDAGLVSKMTNPSGHYFDYTFDGFQRLSTVTENGSRLLSRNTYGLWEHDAARTFGERTDENYVETVLFNYYNAPTDTNQREVQRAFLDPLGRTAGVAKAYKDDNDIKIYSGTLTYDNWGRAIEDYKPFRVIGPYAYEYRTDVTGPKNTTKYEHDPASLPIRKANYGENVDGNNVVRMSSVITNHIYMACELGLTKKELEQVMTTGSTSGFRFRRISVIDQDENETVTYTNAFGQQVATLGWSNLNTKAVTLFIYDNYGNLTRTINPLRQETDYLYNIAGQLIIEKTVDGGTKRFMYNIHGLVSGIQDQVDDEHLTDTDVPAPMYRQFLYDDYGRPTAQNHLTTSYHLDAFCYETLSIGDIDDPDIDVQSNPHYFRYVFSNRMTQDWLNEYETLDPTNDDIEITASGLPPVMPGGAAIAEKTTTYGLSNASPLTLGKIIETKSYNLSGIAVQKVTLTYNTEERLATQEIRQHPNNETTNDSKLVKAKISYVSYNYRGSLTELRLDMGNDASTEMQYFYAYDELNRLTSVRTAQNAIVIPDSATLLATYAYDDERGVVATMTLNADKTTGVNPNTVIQTVNYTYDQRDRLTEIQSPLLQFQLFYDNSPVTGAPFGHDLCYNGNVNGTRAKYGTGVGLFDGPTGYAYNYDRLNRLVKANATVEDYVTAHYANGSNTSPEDAYDIGDETISYDKAGNIITLLRGKVGSAYNLGHSFDDFDYVYTANTNRLELVDVSGGPADRNYTYDANGNLLTDDAREITATGYGRASYAYQVTTASDNISYLYDGADSRFYKKVVGSAQTTEEMYVKDAMGRDLAIVKIVTTGGIPAAAAYEYFVFGNGRVARVTSSGTGVRPMRIYPGEATYFLYDHLGNTRVSFQASGTTTLTTTTVYCGDYYPYGKVLREYDAGDGDRYLTTMHERDDETGLDYRGARYYDCEVARFLSLDPLASKYPMLSAYNYVAGNPIILVDPDGKDIELPEEFVQQTVTGINNWFHLIGGDSYINFAADPSSGKLILTGSEAEMKRSNDKINKIISRFGPSGTKYDIATEEEKMLALFLMDFQAESAVYLPYVADEYDYDKEQKSNNLEKAGRDVIKSQPLNLNEYYLRKLPAESTPEPVTSGSSGTGTGGAPGGTGGTGTGTTPAPAPPTAPPATPPNTPNNRRGKKFSSYTEQEIYNREGKTPL